MAIICPKPPGPAASNRRNFNRPRNRPNSNRPRNRHSNSDARFARRGNVRLAIDMRSAEKDSEALPTEAVPQPEFSATVETTASTSTVAYADEDDDGVLPFFAGEDSMGYKSDAYSVFLVQAVMPTVRDALVDKRSLPPPSKQQGLAAADDPADVPAVHNAPAYTSLEVTQQQHVQSALNQQRVQQQLNNRHQLQQGIENYKQLARQLQIQQFRQQQLQQQLQQRTQLLTNALVRHPASQACIRSQASSTFQEDGTQFVAPQYPHLCALMMAQSPEQAPPPEVPAEHQSQFALSPAILAARPVQSASPPANFAPQQIQPELPSEVSGPHPTEPARSSTQQQTFVPASEDPQAEELANILLYLNSLGRNEQIRSAQMQADADQLQQQSAAPLQLAAEQHEQHSAASPQGAATPQQQHQQPIATLSQAVEKHAIAQSPHKHTAASPQHIAAQQHHSPAPAEHAVAQSPQQNMADPPPQSAQWQTQPSMPLQSDSVALSLPQDGEEELPLPPQTVTGRSFQSAAPDQRQRASNKTTQARNYNTRVATTRSSTARPDSGTSHAEPIAQSTAGAASPSRRADVSIAAIIHTSTLYPPAYLLTGTDKDGLYADETLKESRRKAFENSQHRHEQNAATFNKRKVDPDIKEGDEVFVQAKHKLNRKTLDPPFEGPYPVVSKIGFTTYEVNRKGKTEPFHVSQLKVSKETGRPKRSATAMLAALTLFALLTLMSAKPLGNISLVAPVNFAPATYPLAGSNLTFAPPLVWHETNQVAAVGYNFYRHSAILFSPCTPLRLFFERLSEDVHKGRRHSVARLLNDKVACDRIYKEKVLTTIQMNCLNYQLPAFGTNTRPAKEKRQIIALIATGLVSYGVLTVKNIFEEYIRSSNINELSAQMHKAVSQIKSQNRLNHAFQSELLVALNRTWKEIDSLRFDLEDEATSVRLLTAAISTISETTLHLEQLFDGFKERKVSSAYARLFPDSPLLQEELPAYWMAQKCHYQEPDTLIMDFDVPVINRNIKVMKAESFDFVTEDETGKKCISTFQGNKFTMLNEKTNCTSDISHPATEDRAVVLVPSGDSRCNLHSDRTLKWNLVECGEEINSDRIIQYKLNGDDLYIYCYLHQLKLASQPQINCPNAVIRFNKHQQFAVDGRQYITNSQTFTTQTHLGFSVSDLINNRSFTLPTNDQQSLSFLPAIIKAEKKMNNNLDFPGVESTTLFWSITSGLIVVVALLIAIACWCYCRTQYYQSWRYNLERRRLARLQGTVPFNNPAADTEMQPVAPTGEPLNNASQSVHFRPDAGLVSEVSIL
ncbi:hypothetical protein TYRP_013337 [Tyrophagus putrescentiae]|nr:hypothetical protein TYRP_013337 [Tyrophagus putrescentiae]